MAPLLCAPLLSLQGVPHTGFSSEAGVEVEGDVGPRVGARATLQVDVKPVSTSWHEALDEDHLSW